MTRFSRVLVANRGEIAGRIIATLHAMGLEAAAVFSDVDSDAPYVDRADVAVHLAGRSAAETYLNIDALIGAALRTGCEAVHPGYGFLSESPVFAQAVIDANLTWIGPRPSVIAELGDKVVARRRAQEVGVPVAPAAALTDDSATWAAAAEQVGFPLLVKAVAGGGGRGMRRVTEADELIASVHAAAREAASAFGDARVFLERYLANGRHIEVQVFGDEHGHRVHLFERDCSVQRRHQKVIEEAPAALVSASLREQLTAAAVTLADAIDYVGAGTVEFLVDEDNEELPFVFLEMNTRLQVEHPVTEAVTGLDLVQWQIGVAQGLPLPLRQSDIVCSGHAVEARVYAEDPARGYAPQTGRVHAFHGPIGAGLRTDSGIRTGSVITTDYDSMLAKVIAAAPSRDAAIRRLARGLAELVLHGVTTNRGLLRAVLSDHTFASTGLVTESLDASGDRFTTPELDVVERHVVAAVIASRYQRRERAFVQRDVPAGWRNVGSGDQVVRLTLDRHEIEVSYRGSGAPEHGRLVLTVLGVRSVPQPIEVSYRCAALDAADGSLLVRLSVDGVVRSVRVRGYADGSWWTDASDGNLGLVELPRFVEDAASSASAGGLLAPVPGTVTAVHVQPGDEVVTGGTLVLLEAMKMEHRVVAPHDGTVTEVSVAVGDAVDAHDVLVVVTAHDAVAEPEGESA
jgi:propionyl-CoA carboxylase alpha chain